MSKVSNSIALKEIISQKISSSPLRRITFAEYMDLVLYHPQLGYYNSDHLNIGSQGDFFTSSSLSSDFGELLSVQGLQMWDILGKPSSFTWLEMGAGEGFLANDILSYLENQDPNFLAALDYIIVEKSPPLISKQKTCLQKWLNKGMRISWKTWSQITDNSLVGCLFSNELLDAFPVHKLVKKQGIIQEIYVTLNSSNQLAEINGDLSTNQIRRYFDLLGINLLSSDYPDGYQTEVNLLVLDWINKVSRKLKQGYLLTIDYGYPTHKYYHPQRSQGTLQCYFQHRFHNNPYVNIGEQDITSHVNFTALEIQGNLVGLDNLGCTKQALFLMNLGLGDRLSSLSSGKYTIKELMTRRDYLHQLINPDGLGGFRVLLQSKGLTNNQKQIILKGFQNFDHLNHSGFNIFSNS
jgi:SAM-dependent MidA family methyltransferase